VKLPKPWRDRLEWVFGLAQDMCGGVYPGMIPDDYDGPDMLTADDAREQLRNIPTIISEDTVNPTNRIDSIFNQNLSLRGMDEDMAFITSKCLFHDFCTVGRTEKTFFDVVTFFQTYT
jgi:hypothetical protein